MIDLNNLSQLTFANAEKRMNNGAHIKTDTRNMLKHCATEVVEAMEAFSKWHIACEYDDCFLPLAELGVTTCKNHFSSELADIICCCLIIAEKENIDIENAIIDCVEKNRKRAEGTGDKL